jgi:SAM-dependent methyltransferase
LETALFGNNKTKTLQNFQKNIRDEWRLRNYDARSHISQQVQHHLDGQVLTPLMSILSLHGVFPSDLKQEPVIDLRCLSGNIDNLKTAFQILACMGWANVFGEQVHITPQGMLAMTSARQYWYPMGYLETFIRVPELLFGDPQVTLARTEAGDESHVDRKLDIQFSGSVFSKTCRRPFLDIALPLFDHTSFDLQPRALVDTGCGDGTLLKVLYENIRDRTMRGRKLADYPLTVIGVEPNKIAREVAAANLAECGIPYRTIDGNIAEPSGLARTLNSIGFDPYDALHLSKSVIHNRPYQAPENPVNEKRPAKSTGAFVAPDGSAIPNSLLEQNLVEHFRGWRELGFRHGLLVVEAHTVDPSVTANLIGRSIGTVVDATHAYSNQNLVEPEVFAAAAQKAGFISRAHRELGKESVGHTVLTIDHFVTAE